MRRYTFTDKKSIELNPKEYDVIIVGSGVAGLYTALNLDESLSCLLLSKDDPETCNSWYAQGGVAAVTLSDDDIELHVKDTLVAGAGMCKEEAVRALVTDGPKEILELIEMGVPFDVNDEGELHVTREGGHSMNRILHCGGDATGKELTKRLAYLVTQKKNVAIVPNVFLTDIITVDNRAKGVIVRNGEKIWLHKAPNIVIATGGIGQVYTYTTNPIEATGDGMAAAYRAGAKLKDMEFVQFHPTAFAKDIEGASRCWLISEAVRGEGGILVNNRGERFMVGQHPLAELAPRDIVTRAIMTDMEKTGADCVYIDITHKPKDFLVKRFPTINAICLEHGIDMSAELIPVVPVHHYMMGGVQVDINAMTNIDGLYACGEVSCTGVHGANRLASNSLLECLVFGHRAAKHIKEMDRKDTGISMDFDTRYEIKYHPHNIEEIIMNIKEIMTMSGGIARNQKTMEQGLFRIKAIREMLEESELDDIRTIEALDMATVAENILLGAIKRKESVGAHYLV